MARTNKSTPPVYSAEKVRQGEIILRTRTRRVIFIAGLVAAFAIALLLMLVVPR